MKKENYSVNLIDDLKNDYDRLELDFVLISSWLKQVNENGYYVTYFDPKRIIINNDKVSFPQIASFDKDNFDFIKNSNVKSLASLFFGMGLGHNSSLLPFRFFEENYDKYKNSLSNNMMEYANSLINEGKTEYFSDFVNKKVQDNGISTSKENSLVKATAAGKAFYNNENAFACAIALPVISIIICLVAIFLFIYFI